MELHCEARVGKYSGDMGELAGRYSDGFMPIPVGRQDLHKFGMLKDGGDGAYLLMISDSDTPGPDYNMMMTVMGPVGETARRIMDEWKDSIGIETKEAPEALKQQIEALKRIADKLAI